MLTQRETQSTLADERSSTIFFHQVEDPQQRRRAAETARLISQGATAGRPIRMRPPEGVATFWYSNPTSEEQRHRLAYEVGNDPLSGQKMEAIQDWFLLNIRWLKLRKWRFYREPADVIRAMSPVPSRAANPYHWARTFRVLSEEVARRDPRQAKSLISALSGGERAVGLATVMEQFCAGTKDPLHDEFLRKLPEIECYAWTLDSKDDEPFAYIRPDHRARFEAAIRLLPTHTHYALPLLAESDRSYLSMVGASAVWVNASARYAADVLHHRPQRFRTVQGFHEKILRGQLKTGESLLDDVTLAATVVNEYLAASASNRPVTQPVPLFDDPLYAAVADLMTPADGSPGDAAFVSRIREMLEGPRLPAVAGLLAYAAEVMPGAIGRIRALCEEVLAAASDRPAEERAAALLPLASAAALSDLVDPLELLDQARQLSDDTMDEVLVGLFPTLLAGHPDIALRLVHNDMVGHWDRAMALLESAAKPIIKALGVEGPVTLHEAIRQGLACVSLDGTAPDTVDGVKIPWHLTQPRATER